MIEDSILVLSYEDARNHLLRSDSYVTFNLPEHFSFDELLDDIRNILQNISEQDIYEECKKAKPGDEEGVNYTLLQNKDSRYAWRRFQLINPVLYVALVLHITEERAWDIICKRFQEFSKGKVECASLPLNQSSESSPIYWWQMVEQRSIELSLQFEHILTADLANCYDSIYTHSLAWALHGKDIAKKHRNSRKHNYIGNEIDWYLQAMNHRQTNGIPTGSTLMDLIAEMILGYMDLELTEKLKCRITNEETSIGNYHILRYRDDYRIFVNDLTTGIEVMRALTEVALTLGFQLNTAKTKTSDNIVKASMKEDKIAWITRKQKQDDKNLKNKEYMQRHIESNLLKNLLIIHDHSCQFPNAGSLEGALKNYQDELKKNKPCIRSPAARVLISTVTDIAYRNPLRQRRCAALLSELFSLPCLGTR